MRFVIPCLLAACASGSEALPRGLELARRGEVETAVAELRRAVAESPRDPEAHAALGRLERKAGRPGAALRELELAWRLGGSGGNDELIELCLGRARALGRRGSPGRWRWYHRAREVDPRRVQGQEVEAARRDYAAALWRAGDEVEARRVWPEISRPAEPAPAPPGASAADAALHRPPRSPAPPLDVGPEPAALADALAVLLASWVWGDREAWIDDAAAWFVERTRAGRPISDFPPWIRPTLHRLADERAAARAALASAGEGAPPHGRLVIAYEQAFEGSPGAGRQALGGDELPLFLLARIDLARLAGDERGEAAALARAAAAGGPVVAEALARRLDVAPLLERPEVARRVRRWQRLLPRLSPGAGAGLVERWRALGGREPLPLGQEKDDLGRAPRARPAAPEGCTVDARRFAEVEAAFLVDAGLADRRARELVDGDISSVCPGHALADLFLRAGDPARALAWAEEVAAEDPTDALAHQQVATALARQGNTPRAQLALQQAEFWSRRRGEPSRILARELLAVDRPVEALGAGRQALSLAPAGERWSVFEVLVEAARAAGREEDARALSVAARAELPEGARERAAAPPERESPWAVAAKERRAQAERPGTAARLGIEAELLLQGLLGDGPLARAALEAFARLAEADGLGDLAAEARSEARRLPGGLAAGP